MTSTSTCGIDRHCTVGKDSLYPLGAFDPGPTEQLTAMRKVLRLDT